MVVAVVVVVVVGGGVVDSEKIRRFFRTSVFSYFRISINIYINKCAYI